MRTQVIGPALTLVVGAWVAGCGNQVAEGNEPETGLLEEPVLENTSPPSPFVEREFWLALAEEPGWHLNLARQLFLDGETDRASQELGKVAAMLNFESRHSHSPKEQGLLLASVQELREVARQLRFKDVPLEGSPSVHEFDRVSALTFRTIAEHQVALARDALGEGDVRMVGRLVVETAKALENGFLRSEVDPGHVMTQELQHAKEEGRLMELDGEGSREEAVSVLDDLDSAVNGLTEVVTSRRK